MDKLNALIKTHPVIFFSKDDCPYCDKLADYLTELRITPFKKVMLESDIREALIEMTSCKTVPQLFINGKFIGGYTDFVKITPQRLEQLLAPIGITPYIDF